jgi:large conductance mechanosensitive channel
MSLMKDFRDFAVRGNAMDLAIGVIIGGAFNKIVTALVDSVIMPVLGLIIGNTKQFEEWTVGNIRIGALIQSVLDFVIIAFVLFMLVKGINRLKDRTLKDNYKAPPSKTEALLAEIRDLMKDKEQNQ